MDYLSTGGTVVGAARGDRVSLEFLLELGHELRTPAGIVAGYLSMARQGEISAEEAVEVAGAKADELCSLLDDLLKLSAQQLNEKGRWRRRVREAQAESERLGTQTTAAMESARRLLERLQAAGRQAERT